MIEYYEVTFNENKLLITECQVCVLKYVVICKLHAYNVKHKPLEINKAIIKRPRDIGGE